MGYIYYGSLRLLLPLHFKLKDKFAQDSHLRYLRPLFRDRLEFHRFSALSHQPSQFILDSVKIYIRIKLLLSEPLERKY